MKQMIMVVLLSTALLAQQPKQSEPPKVSEFTGFMVDTTSSEAGRPKTVREYAMQQFKEFNDYNKLNGMDHQEFSLTWQSGGTYQEAIINGDGKVVLNNMTLEDALLYLVATQIGDELRKEYKWDTEKKKAEEERKTNPPTTLKSSKGIYKITPVHKLPADILATTNCRENDIDVLISQNTKRASVLHEMMHVATDCDGSPSLHRSIYELSNPLLKLMQDNPAMVDYLMNKTKTEWPAIAPGSIHLILDSVQAKEQDHPIPVCTPESKTTCYDPSLPHITNHLYNKKQNCEMWENAKCTDLYNHDQQLWAPIGKPVFEDKSEKP